MLAIRFRSWVVRKPTSNGDVTSLELYDQDDDRAVQFIGARQPGIPERDDWRDLIGRVGV
jgi:putative hemin transport protein